MTPKEVLIDRLKALCKTHGVDVVAAKARVSEENLRQILSGIKLPSGQPRGVGPTIQRKLEAAFPGWAEQPIGPRLPGRKFEDRHESARATGQPFRRSKP